MSMNPWTANATAAQAARPTAKPNTVRVRMLADHSDRLSGGTAFRGGLAPGALTCTVSDPGGSGINIGAEDGSQVARFGTGHGPLGNQPLNTQMFLNDQSGVTRIRLSVPEDGTPGIFIYDADGSVTWTAP